MTRTLYTLLLLLASAWASADQLPAAVNAVLAKHRLPVESLSVIVQDVVQTTPLLAVNADTPRNPASVIKLLTTFVALDVLGPTYTWKTEVYADGSISKEQLRGNLILKGFGDPFLVTESFWKLLRGARDRGVQDVTGDLVIDDSFFAPPPHDPSAFDGRPLRPYNVGPSALLVNFQTVGFTFLPDTAARRVRITPEPSPANLSILNNIKYLNGKCRGRQRILNPEVSRTDTETTVRFTGRYPAGCGEYVLHRAVMNPVPLAYGVFRNLWAELGGSLGGGVRTGLVPAKARRLYTLQSRPLAELLRGVNKYSNNVMARHLLLTMGAERYGPPGTVEKGRTAISDWLRARQLDFPELFVANGSGLSRQTRISVRSLGRLLVMAYHHPFLAELASSLPIAAVDGTLRRRFRGETLARRARMKTGTINDVKGIAGFLSSRAGRTYAVAILQNHAGVHRGPGTEVQNVLLRWLYQQ